MSWDTDTNGLLDNDDGDGGTVVVVKSYDDKYDATSVIPEAAVTIIETATVLLFPQVKKIRMGLSEGQSGWVVDSSHTMFFPSTSSVAVGHRIYESGETDFYKVLLVGDYDGHKQVYSDKVEKR